MDQGIGLVLEALERQGLADETLVFFSSDNRPPFVNSKTTLYDAGMRLPFIVRVPGKDAGAIPLNMLLYIDVFPTLLTRQGKVIASRLMPAFDLVRDDQSYQRTRQPSKKHGITYAIHTLSTKSPPTGLGDTCETDGISATAIHAQYVATKDWQEAAEERKKKRLPGELYDLEADPKEVHDLAGTLEYDSVVKQMREEVKKRQMETKDLVAAERWYFSAAIQRV
ncbi:N-sulfoglucosamine sulfohydrolase [Metarhizium anisopliae]